MTGSAPTDRSVPERVTNFGRNVTFQATVLRPRSHDEVLDALNRFAGGRIRAVGSLHSWSNVCVSDVVLDLRSLTRMALVEDTDGRMFIEIDAGCRIETVLHYLESRGYTLPTLPATGVQTVAGAISTGTHGSGRPSLSHYVSRAWVAGYSATGAAKIFDIDDRERLRAVRCGIGATGIVLTVRMPVEPTYFLEEKTAWFGRLRDVLANAREYPRLQFYLVPWSWRWFAQLRRRFPAYMDQRPSLMAPVQRATKTVLMDVVFNGAIRLVARSPRLNRVMRWLWCRVFPLIARNGLRTVDRSRRVVMMRRELYTHAEMELFVPEEFVERAVLFVKWVLRVCAGEATPFPSKLLDGDRDRQTQIKQMYGFDVEQEIEDLPRPYVHDYLITFRRVLPDDTLMSMSSGYRARAWYAISLVTYQRDLNAFISVGGLLARALAHAYGARPHWGKIYPLDANAVAKLYPRLDEFRQICASFDPNQVFVNDFARQHLGFAGETK